MSAAAATQFSSHINVNTPARSYSHGVGDPVHLLERRAFQRQSQRAQQRSLRRSPQGYPQVKPTVPFTAEEAPPFNSLNAPWQYNNYVDVPIPVLPPSPYKVDSPDPESLWPEGLFLPPVPPPRFGVYSRRIDSPEVTSESEISDPYLLEGSEAIEAVQRANLHGNLYFHDIPHIMSLLENQQLRIKNQLKPHRLASIRHTWPYYRP
ncbi:uncharacterized protein LOC128669631 isoform X2 [Plodia interpunctella]|nr:uncharacterized protein LOC128669631 isoform X2 [Plodia interpunctella]